MEHLNYCRQMVKQFEMDVSSLNKGEKQLLIHCIGLARSSQKFLLPDGGTLYVDTEFRALDETVPLRLPYPEVAIPLTNYIDRGFRRDGCAGIVVHRLKNPFWNVPASEYMDEIGALLSMLNVLNCKNVNIDDSAPRRVRKAKAGGKKAALPFDSYKVLTVDVPAETSDKGTVGTGRSPREHLRRGHIRRLADGRRVWVNATVVASGRGAGVVTKDYAISKRRMLTDSRVRAFDGA